MVTPQCTKLARLRAPTDPPSCHLWQDGLALDDMPATATRLWVPQLAIAWGGLEPNPLSMYQAQCQQLLQVNMKKYTSLGMQPASVCLPMVHVNSLCRCWTDAQADHP